MTRRSAILAIVLLLLAAACSGSSAEETTTTTAASTTSEATTTTVAETTTSEATTTTTSTTVAETTTTTVEDTTTTTLEGDTTTTTGGEGEDGSTTTTTTKPPPPPTTSTTLAPGSIDPALEQWSGLFRQPAGYGGYLQFRADGVVLAGFAYESLPFEGTWGYDAAADMFVFSDFDVAGADCDGADGRYARETAPGGGRRLTLVEDPCGGRVDFLTLPDSPCQCMTWLRVDEPGEDDE